MLIIKLVAFDAAVESLGDSADQATHREQSKENYVRHI
jgi:hypothetical protein